MGLLDFFLLILLMMVINLSIPVIMGVLSNSILSDN